ncbi:MAG TPA: hypothetical protein VKB76_00760 [Ktedonobacterales bacterium]|nr:hypothetical protein [Ktedonobacterales bacterium]
MLLLSFFWLLIGAGVGALSVAAGWGFAGEGWSRRNIWLATMGVGALAALIGGWLGNLLFDRYYTTPTALWVSVLGSALSPRLIGRMKHLPQAQISKPVHPQ